MFSLKQELLSAWPGLLLVLALAGLSRTLHGFITEPVLSKSISEILIAVLLGLLVGNLWRLNASIRAGAKFALNRLLRLGIVLLGLRPASQDVAATGLSALALKGPLHWRGAGHGLAGPGGCSASRPNWPR